MICASNAASVLVLLIRSPICLCFRTSRTKDHLPLRGAVREQSEARYMDAVVYRRLSCGYSAFERGGERRILASADAFLEGRSVAGRPGCTSSDRQDRERCLEHCLDRASSVLYGVG